MWYVRKELQEPLILPCVPLLAWKHTVENVFWNGINSVRYFNHTFVPLIAISGIVLFFCKDRDISYVMVLSIIARRPFIICFSNLLDPVHMRQYPNI